MLFREFVDICKRVSAAKSTTEKIGIIASYMGRLGEDELTPYILFLTGNPVPDNWENGLGVGYKTLLRALRNPYKPLVDAGPPTLSEVYNELVRIALARGRDSMGRKEAMLRSLMGRMGGEERRWLSRIILGELRIGVVDGHIVSSIAHHLNVSQEKVRRLYMFMGSLYEMVEAIKRGVDLDSLKPRVYVPLKPMLGAPASTIQEGYNLLGVAKAAVEEKYDGFRIQVHIGGGGVRIFSRNLTDVTSSFPELVEAAESIDTREAIIDGEAVAIAGDGRPLPFQILMRRFRRVADLEEYRGRIPVTMKLFDLLYLNGELYIDSTYLDRRRKLEEIVPERLLSRVAIDVGVEDAEKFYRESIRLGNEGVMIKRLDSPYVLGSRGRYWVKVKDKETLDVVVVGAEWGHGRRRGWLSDYYLAVYNPYNGEYEMVGKTFKGLTDEEFRYMTRRLKELVVRDEGYRVFVKPEIVVEVDFNEIQESPKYRSGYALRLARIRRIREDKKPDEAATIDDLKRLYEEQFRRKARL